MQYKYFRVLERKSPRANENRWTQLVHFFQCTASPFVCDVGNGFFSAGDVHESKWKKRRSWNVYSRGRLRKTLKRIFIVIISKDVENFQIKEKTVHLEYFLWAYQLSYWAITNAYTKAQFIYSSYKTKTINIFHVIIIQVSFRIRVFLTAHSSISHANKFIITIPFSFIGMIIAFINNRDSAVSEYISASTQQYVNVHTRIELKANLTSHYISINFKWEMQLFEITFDLEAPKEWLIILE